MKLGWLILALTGLSGSADCASYRIAPYEGPDAVRTGEGGTRLSRHGIDFWTSGTPPRRYKMLGIIHDERNDYMDGEPGSKKVAKAIRSAGGDAAIVMTHTSSKRTGSARPIGGAIIAFPVTDTMTDIMVIKYQNDAK